MIFVLYCAFSYSFIVLKVKSIRKPKLFKNISCLTLSDLYVADYQTHFCISKQFQRLLHAPLSPLRQAQPVAFAGVK